MMGRLVIASLDLKRTMKGRGDTMAHERTGGLGGRTRKPTFRSAILFPEVLE
jgi:hypothetical protein